MRPQPGLAIFLPGMACRSWIWEGAARRLGVRRETRLVDWPRDKISSWRRLDDFADWLIAAHAEDLARAEVLVGHSMGGLLALRLCGREAPRARAVLCETFLLPPPVFFRNLTAPGTEAALTARLRAMLDGDRDLYDPRLKEDLRASGHAAMAADCPAPIRAVYGMRSSPDEAEVRARLAWPQWLCRRAALSFVPESAHFPMLEQPAACLRTLMACLDQGTGA